MPPGSLEKFFFQKNNLRALRRYGSNENSSISVMHHGQGIKVEFILRNFNSNLLNEFNYEQALPK
jgi:purine-nucleoside phosphorylase